MKKLYVGGTLAVAFLGATLAAAQVPPQPTTPYYPPPAGQYPQYPQYPMTTTDTTAKNPLLLALVIQPVLQQGGAALAAGVGALFSRLFAALSGHGSGAGAAAQPGVAGAYGISPGVPGYPGAPNPYGAPGAYPAPYGATTPTYPGATNPYGAPVTPAYPGATSPYGTPATATYPGATNPYGTPATPAYPGGTNPYGAPATPPTAPYGTPGTYTSTPANPAVPTYGTPAYPSPAGGAYPAAPNAGSTTAAAGVPTPGAATTMPVGKSAVLPSVVFSLLQLDSHSYATTNRLDLTHGAPTLRTGDVFAIEYAANVSGQVRIDNIDSRGQRSALGTYTVLAGHDNRIPRTKGIQLTGTTGTETFKLYFFPCVPPGADTKAQNMSAGLPACPDSPNPQLLQASKGVLLAKGAVNLDSPDPTIAVSAAQDYQPNDITESDFQINHTEGP
jgi:hypothetical protein